MVEVMILKKFKCGESGQYGLTCTQPPMLAASGPASRHELCQPLRPWGGYWIGIIVNKLLSKSSNPDVSVPTLV